MRIGLRLLLGFFLILGLALFVVLRVFIAEVKPGARLAMEDSLVDTAWALASLAAPDLKAGVMGQGAFAEALRTLDEARPNARIWGFDKSQVDLRVTITDTRGIVIFDSLGQAEGHDHSRWNDVYLTLRGRYGARSSPISPDEPDATIMHVAAPIRDGDHILGVLTVSRPNHRLDPYIQRSQQRILRWSWALLGISLVMGLLVSWWLASSLSRLRGYALAVSRGERAELPRLGRLSGETEFTDLARALERMRLKLEDKAYVENYVHTLTHELKSPLAAIRGSAELLQEDLPAADRGRFATSIQKQTERLQQLIERLLALADVEHLRQLEQVEEIDLSTLTHEVLQTLEPRLRRKRLRVKAGLAAGARLRGNRFLLAQALRNLLDNAIDFSPEGGDLDLRVWAADGRIRWSVRDQGPGIPEYARDRIFDRFYSLPRGDGQDRSSGLGLCLVKEVAELHGGEASVRDAGNPSGCEALLSLPFRPPRGR